jgi:hypothetical protein
LILPFLFISFGNHQIQNQLATADLVGKSPILPSTCFRKLEKGKSFSTSSDNPQKDNFHKTFFRLTNSTFSDKQVINSGLTDKAKPFVKRGQKAAGLSIRWPNI